MPQVERPRGAAVSRRAVLVAAAAAPFAVPALSACDSAGASSRTLRLGYFANVTHAPAMAGVARGTFARHLGGTTIAPQVFTNGPAAVQALLAGALDIAYLGPNPAITALVRTKGKGVRLIAGACENGAALVARPGIDTVQQLAGRTASTPQLGGTQDVALKQLLRDEHLRVGSGKHEVEVLWMDNAQTLDQFKQGRLDASYQAEPWVSRLVLEAGAHVLVDEKTRWPTHRFATTTILATQDYLDEYRDKVERFLAGHIESIQWLRTHAEACAPLLNSEIRRLTGKKLKKPVMKRALKNVEVSWDPLMSNVAQVAQHTWATGGIDVEPDLHGLVDVAPLNRALGARGLPKVSDAGYGVKEGSS